MEIKLRTKEEGIISLGNIPDFIEIKPNLMNIYQNSSEIKNVIMEKGQTYGQVGCRATAFYRQIIHRLSNFYKVNDAILTFQEFDALIDEGGEKGDAWMDGKYPDGSYYYNLIDAFRVVEKVNKKYNVNMKYRFIDKKMYDSLHKDELFEYVKNNIPITVRLLQLYSKNERDLHFVNIDAAVKINEDIYFRLKETYTGYDGYNGYWIKWDYPGYYEIVV